MKQHLTESEIDAIACAAHEVNRAYCRLMGDNSHRPWANAPAHAKQSARAGVVGMATNEYTPEQSHESWSRFKIADGWRYGPVKDEVDKTHPCLVPYSELPVEQRYKDTLYTQTVKALLSRPHLR